MQSVTYKFLYNVIMLSINLLNAILLNVVASKNDLTFNLSKGRGGSTAVEHSTTDHEVQGLNLASSLLEPEVKNTTFYPG